MKYNLARVVPRSVVGLAALAIASSLSSRAIAQETYPACEPPDAGEYLLLVQGDTETAETQLQEAFPEGVDVTVCTYIDSVITRVGGFSDADTAATWAQYLSDIGNLEAYVARPAQAAPDDAAEVGAPDAESAESPEAEPAPVEDASADETPDEPVEEAVQPEPRPPRNASPSRSDADETSDETSQQSDVGPETAEEARAFPAPNIPPAAVETTTTSSVTEIAAEEPEAAMATAPVYDPKILGDGYAVLVEYFDQPDIAAELQQSLGRNVGLVVYNQQPYLLASHTASGEAASTLLRDLSADFTVMLVDGRNVVLISPAIAVSQ